MVSEIYAILVAQSSAYHNDVELLPFKLRTISLEIYACCPHRLGSNGLLAYSEIVLVDLE